MSEESPQRLKEFRSQYKPLPQPVGKFAIAQFAVMVIGFGAVIGLIAIPRTAKPSSGGAVTAGGLPVETQREYAVRLEEKKQPIAAIAAYEDYLRMAPLGFPERAKVCYSIAKLAVDAERYDTALPYLYQAEFLDPKSNLKDDINKKVVLCLDKLGRNVDLRHELRTRSDVKKKAEDVKSGEKVLAECAGEVITDRDLELEIEKLPPAARDSFNTPDKKAELLKNLVAERLLLDKAKRLELDKTPEIQEQLGKQLDAMIVQKLIADEVKSSVSVTPEDVERFYKAEPDRFKEPAQAEVRIGKADTEDAAKALTEFADKPVTVSQGGHVPGVSALAVPDAIFTTDPEGVTAPVESDKTWYVFKVVSKKPERMPSFDEVKDQAARMLQMQKQQEKVQAMIDETLQSRDVKLHLDRLSESESKK